MNVIQKSNVASWKSDKQKKKITPGLENNEDTFHRNRTFNINLLFKVVLQNPGVVITEIEGITCYQDSVLRFKI